jgi:phosphate uptake regulator
VLLDQMSRIRRLRVVLHASFWLLHLERIGDYVKDICELIVYMKEVGLSNTAS